MSKYSLTEMAVKMFCPGNVVQVDDAGLPSVLVWIPKFKLSDVLNTEDNSTHPAFIVNGKEIPGFYYSKYENVVRNGKAYSLPAETPQNAVNFDKAREYCEAKGYGWHLSTAAEWAAITLWCKKIGTLPYGNNDYGKDKRESSRKAIPAIYGATGNVNTVATGTGPLTWSHDKTASGIWDLNGNLVERLGGIRLVWGELQILANNDAADPDNPQNETSTCWKAINAADGTLVDPESKTTDTAVKTSGDTVKLDFVNNAWTYTTGISNAEDISRSCLFANATCDGTIGAATKMLLRALAFLPDEGASKDDYESNGMYWNNMKPECCIYRGGNWPGGVSSGVFTVSGDNIRAAVGIGIGFRSAYIPDLG